VAGRRCVLAGVEVPSEVGPQGHSDGDVVLHALTDAILGAAATGDIGSVFGTTRPEWRDAPSSRFVEEALRLAGSLAVINVDVTVMGARPRLAEYRDEMRKSLARLLDTSVEDVSVKFSSGNGLGELGRGEGIAATVVAIFR
jgi:2-C-methyl-D-erythritol 2,4-cyclodiphosphate synthase